MWRLLSITDKVFFVLFSITPSLAYVRFLEFVNIEFEVAGTDNRILDVSPASFKGTRIYDGSNDIAAIRNLAAEIIEQLFRREVRYIPQYAEIYKAVLEHYQADPHAYGSTAMNLRRTQAECITPER